MMNKIVIGMLTAGGTLFAINQGMKTSLVDLYNEMGARYRVPPTLLQAIAKVESGENPLAVSFAGAIGVMQINPNAGFKGIDGFPAPSIKDYFNPELNIKIAAQVLRWNLDNYGYPRGIAVYNSWSARNYALHGPFPNQEYVDKVLAFYEG